MQKQPDTQNANEIQEGAPFPNLPMTDRLGTSLKVADLAGVWVVLFHTAETTPELAEVVEAIVTDLKERRVLCAGFVPDDFPDIDSCVLLKRDEGFSTSDLPSYSGPASFYIVDHQGIYRKRFTAPFDASFRTDLVESIKHLQARWLSAW